MRRCVNCGEIYNSPDQLFCSKDGGRITETNQMPPPTVNYQNQTHFPPPAPVKKSNGSLFLIGGIAAVVVALLGVVGVIGAVMFSKRSTGTTVVNLKTTPTPVKSANSGNTTENPDTTEAENPADDREKIEAEIKMTINSANDAQTAANTTYNTTPLKNYYIGKALESFINDVNTLKKSNIYQIGVLKEQTFESIEINEAGDEAEVKMTEEWESFVYNKTTKKCLSYYAPIPYPQTLILKKTPRGWMVDSVKHESDAENPAKPCPAQRPE